MAVLIGCRQEPPRAPTTQDSRPVVLTTFTVLADLARVVAGERLQVRSITRPGAEIHGYEPTPADLEGAQGADLIVENGLGLERWAERFVRTAGDVPRLTLSQGMTPLMISHRNGTSTPNPHAWLSPRRVRHYVDHLVSAFSALDPDGAAEFRANGEAYKNQLDRLDDELRSALAAVPPQKRLLVSCEGAFSYLARDYGLEEAYLWPVNGEQQVTPRRLAALIETVRRRRVPALFCESTVSHETQLEVVRATGSRYGGTFYVDSLSQPSGPAATLLALQRHNVRLIVQGLAPGGEKRP
ncbi:MAG: metal ABC transporter substrate-binding protein [Cyanobacteriota bacterium]|nr:metal ABC transporter substrate-binding protein [Cyanobacteriota bacterium]